MPSKTNKKPKAFEFYLNCYESLNWFHFLRMLTYKMLLENLKMFQKEIILYGREEIVLGTNLRASKADVNWF